MSQDQTENGTDHSHRKWLLPLWRDLKKPILCVDFDGCISNYKHPWRGVAELTGDSPVPGAFDFLEKAIKKFTVLIFSSRCNAMEGIAAMQGWMLSNGLKKEVLDELYFQPGKPSAFMIIDDRARQFTGDWSEFDPDEMLKFEPWYYEESRKE